MICKIWSIETRETSVNWSDLEWVVSVKNGVSNNIRETLLINSYGRGPIIDIQEKKNILKSISDDFCNLFISNWYENIAPVWINSWIDKTVYFIGSPTSVLKPYLLNGTLPKKWICMQQPSFRTHNAKRLRNDTPIKWGSYFTAFSCMSNYSDWELLLEKTIEFFLEKMKVPLNNIRININSKDDDLLAMLKTVWNPIPLNFDSEEDKYYKHKYWLWDIVGRNFNILLKDENTEIFNDVWNFIIISDGIKKYGIESGYWDSTIMKELYSMEHVLETSAVSHILPWCSVACRKLQDSIISSFLMLSFWIIPRRHDTKWMVLKRYLNWIDYNMKTLGLVKKDITDILKTHEKIEYPNSGYADIILSKIW